MRKRIVFSQSLFPTKVGKDLSQGSPLRQKAFLDERGDEIQCALGKLKCSERVAQSQAQI